MKGMNLYQRMHFSTLAELKRGLAGHGRNSVINMQLFFERGRWSCELIEQWSQFFQACNWYTFNPVVIELEDNRALGDLELKLVLLGVGFRLSWNHTVTEMRRDLQAQVTEINRVDSAAAAVDGSTLPGTDSRPRS